MKYQEQWRNINLIRFRVANLRIINLKRFVEQNLTEES